MAKEHFGTLETPPIFEYNFLVLGLRAVVAHAARPQGNPFKPQLKNKLAAADPTINE